MSIVNMSIDILTLKKRMADRLVAARKEINDFRLALDVDPADALYWVNGAVRAATVISVFSLVERANFETSSAIQERARSRVRHLLRDGASMSTSFLEGQLRMEEMRAWDEIDAMIDGRI